MLVSLKNITKCYPGVKALDNFSIDFLDGEIHALLGENGAGKSTLIKIIAGAVEPDSGAIKLGDETFSLLTPLLAREKGVEVIYQEFNLVNSLSVAENIFLGTHDGMFPNMKKLQKKTLEIFKLFNVNIDPAAKVRDLSPAQQQIVEISKAIANNANVLIMDEPTAPLTVDEVENLFKIVRELKSNGVTIIYISHRLEEIFYLSDRVTVMRDGQFIETFTTGEVSRQELLRQMVGRELKESYPESKSTGRKEPVLEIKGLWGNGCEDISFSLYKGEIMGLAGLVGAGRTELVRVLFGAEKMDKGEIYLNGDKINIHSPKDAISYGIGLIPEDRKQQGCFLTKSIKWNISAIVLKKISRFIFIDSKKEDKLASEYKKLLKIKAPALTTRVETLSGGNQQKIVLAKTLASDCRILIFDEPTRGIDVGAKQEIYHLMRSLTEKGISIIMISSEMEELIGMSDRIVVVSEKKYAGTIDKNDFEQTKILELASMNTIE